MNLLSTHRLRAYNYATASENFIHADDGGGRFGFRGGLVPGIGVYAYMMRPALERWGDDWLARGWAKAKFIKPVYDGEWITIETSEGEAPGSFDIRVSDEAGGLRAVGLAGLANATDETVAPRAEDYPCGACPEREARRAADLSALQPGTEFGRRDLKLDLALAARTFVRDVLDESSRFTQAPYAAHPALLLAQANYLFRDNIALGAWIHTASEVRNFATPENGETISLRGRVVEARERRGHQIVTADLALFGRDNRALARIRHEAIIKLAEPQA